MKNALLLGCVFCAGLTLGAVLFDGPDDGATTRASSPRTGTAQAAPEGAELSRILRALERLSEAVDRIESSRAEAGTPILIGETPDDEAVEAPAVPTIAIDHPAVVALLRRVARQVLVEERKAPILRSLRARLASSRESKAEMEVAGEDTAEVLAVEKQIADIVKLIGRIERARTNDDLSALLRDRANAALLDG